MGFGDIVILGLGICLLIGGVIPVASRVLLRRLGRRTRGSVVDFIPYSDSSGVPARACVVEYLVAGERFRVTGRWSADGGAFIGAERTVYYWPRNPQRGYLVDATSWTGPLIVSLSGVLLGATALGLSFI